MAFVSVHLEFLPFLRFLRDIITSVGTVIRNSLRRFTLFFFLKYFVFSIFCLIFAADYYTLFVHEHHESNYLKTITQLYLITN